jgi:hypothetical protein
MVNRFGGICIHDSTGATLIVPSHVNAPIIHKTARCLEATLRNQKHRAAFITLLSSDTCTFYKTTSQLSKAAKNLEGRATVRPTAVRRALHRVLWTF